jgi:hypothetical protein
MSNSRYYQNILLALVHKLAPGQKVELTAADFDKVMEDFPTPDKPYLIVGGSDQVLTLSVVDSQQAQVLEDFQRLQRKAAEKMQ